VVKYDDRLGNALDTSPCTADENYLKSVLVLGSDVSSDGKPN